MIGWCLIGVFIAAQGRPDAAQMRVFPDLRGISRGAAAVTFDPGAAGMVDGPQLILRQRWVNGEPGWGRVTSNAVYPLGPLSFLIGHNWVALTDLSYRRMSVGAALRLHRTTSFGFAYRWYGGPDDIRGVGFWDVSLLVAPVPWISMSLGMEQINRPTVSKVREPVTVDLGIGIRPWRGDSVVTVGGEARFEMRSEQSQHIRVQHARALLGVEPLVGLKLLAGYQFDAIVAAKHRLWLGMSFGLGHFEAGIHGAAAPGEHWDEDLAWSVLWRKAPRRNLLTSKAQTVHVSLKGNLRDVSRNWWTKPPQVPRVLWRLRRLVKRPDVSHVVISLDDLKIGLAMADEVATAIEALRRAKKHVTVVLSTVDEKGYRIATEANWIIMDPIGGLELDGFSLTSLYFAKALEKLRVRFDAVAIGAYKTAPDTLTRSGPRPEAIEVKKNIVHQAFNTLTDAILRNRKTTWKQLKQAFHIGQLSPSQAQELGLIDAVVTPSSQAEQLVQRLPATLSLEATLQQERRAEDLWGRRPVIAVIPIKGMIVAGGGLRWLPRAQALADQVVAQLQRVQHDPYVIGVVLRIDSPGGSVMASEAIWRAVRRVVERKPVVVSMGNVAASGAYWIAVGADTILAEPNTLTGSIGIFYLKPDLSGWLDWGEVGVNRVKKGKHTSWKSWLEPLKLSDRKMIKNSLEYYYDNFLQRVAKGRGLKLKDVRRLAGGRVYTGQEAFELGLVDGMGGLADAVEEICARIGDHSCERVRLYIPSGSLDLKRLVRSLMPKLIQLSPMDVELKTKTWALVPPDIASVR